MGQADVTILGARVPSAYLSIPRVGAMAGCSCYPRHIRNCHRSAEDRWTGWQKGYLAEGLNLFHGDNKLRCIRIAMNDPLAPKGRTFGDLETARAWLAEREDCTGRIGVLSYRMGGSFRLAPRATRRLLGVERELPDRPQRRRRPPATRLFSFRKLMAPRIPRFRTVPERLEKALQFNALSTTRSYTVRSGCSD